MKDEMHKCPQCGERHPDTRRERRPNGDTTCGGCGFRITSKNWDANGEAHERHDTISAQGRRPTSVEVEGS